jgi:hypothetical protein
MSWLWDVFHRTFFSDYYGALGEWGGDIQDDDGSLDTIDFRQLFWRGCGQPLPGRFDLA